MSSKTFDALKERTVLDLKKQQVSVKSLFEEGGAVIFLIRRLQCPICREDALELSSSLKEELDSRTPPVRLIAITGNTLGHEEFREDYWSGELYCDPGKEGVFTLMQEPRLLVRAVESLFTAYHIISGHLRTQSKKIAGGLNYQSATELVNGGIWIINSGDQGILFEHAERAWGAPVASDKIDQLREAVGHIGASTPDVAG